MNFWFFKLKKKRFILEVNIKIYSKNVLYFILVKKVNVN